MPNGKKDVKGVKKFALKVETKTPPVVDMNETVASFNLAEKVRSSKEVSFKTILDSCNLQQVQDIKNYIKHDKSNISVKLERIGLYSPELLQLQRLRDFINNVIDLGTDLIHDGVIRECTGSDGIFDVDSF